VSTRNRIAGSLIVSLSLLVSISLAESESVAQDDDRKVTSAATVQTLDAKANVQLDTGEFPSARRTYRSILKSLEGEPVEARVAPYLGLARSLIGLREYEEARGIVAAVLDSVPYDEWTAQVKRRAGDIALLTGDFAKAETFLRDALADSVDRAARDTLLIQLAECAFRQERWREAASLFASPVIGDSLLIPFARYRIAASLARDGAVDEALAVLSELADRHEDRWLAVRALQQAFEIQCEHEMWDEALRSGAALLARHRDRVDAGLVLYRMGRCEEERGRRGSATKFYAQILRDHWESEGSMSARDRLEELGQLSIKDRYYAGRISYAAGRHRTAISDFSRYLRRYPNGPHAAEARYWEGRAQFDRRRYRDAEAAFRSLISSSSGPDYGARGLYFLGRTYVRAGKDEDAIASYRRLASRYPTDRLADDGLYWVGRIYEDAGDFADAYEAYAQVSEQFPHGDMAPSALYRRALIAIRDSEWDDAIRVLSGYVRRYPEDGDLPAATYWLGRSHQTKGDTDQAAAAYERVVQDWPRHYYAWLAAGRLDEIERSGSSNPVNETGHAGRDRVRFFSIISPPPIDPARWLSSWVDRGAKRESNRSLPPAGQRAMALAALGLIEAAQEEFEGLDQAANPHQALLAAEAASGAGLDLEAISFARDVLQQAQRGGRHDIPKRLLELLYPASFAELIDDAALENGLDPCLLLAVIREESRFDPEALSRARAMGLMQIIAPTAKKLAKELDVPSFVIDDLYRPAVSIRFGAWYLRGLLEEFGRPELALAAYNAGESRVREWLEKSGTDELDLFVESIPFQETRQYVKRVMGSYHVYQALWGSRFAPQAK